MTASNKDTTTTSLSNTNKTQVFKGEILLQTAQAVISGALVCVLFDCGSQRSYMTESILSQIEIIICPVREIYLNTFGPEVTSLPLVKGLSNIEEV